MADQDEAEGFPFRDFFENSPDILSIMDAKGRLLANSPASERIHGYGGNRLVGQDTGSFVHPEDREGVQSALAEAFAEPGRVVLIRYRYRNADGSWIWMEATGLVGRKEGEEPRLYVCSRDARRQVEGETLLARTVKEKEALLHEIQHRVKNSIAMISSFIALEEGRAAEEGGSRILENLRFRVDSISTLYRLLFSTGDPTTVELRSYLEKLVSDISQTIDRPGVALRLELDELSIDTKRAVPLGILCTELVSNALRHGFDEGGEGSVGVRLSSAEGRLRLLVEDGGRGLPGGFDLAREEGLGLQIARMLALQLKGRLEAGPGEGRGARFLLDMPLAAG